MSSPSEPAAEVEQERLYFPPPDEREFSFRSIVVGCILGGIVAAMNIYLGLRIGWSFGGSLIAAILGFSVFASLGRIGLLKTPYTILEANITQTAGSAAGTMTSAAGLLAAIPAMRMLGYEFSYIELTLWALAVAYLGVFFAVPLRRQMVLVEKLRFPTGTAAAQTIMAMFSSGGEAERKGKALMLWGVIAAGFTVATHFIPAIEHPDISTIGLSFMAAWGFSFIISPMMMGAGILIGPRVGVSLLLGATIGWLVVGIPVWQGGLACGPTLVDGIWTTGAKQACIAPGAVAGFVEAKEPLLARLVHLADLGGTTGNAAIAGLRGHVRAMDPMVWKHGGLNDYGVGIKGWILWPGVAIMVADALTSLGLSWRTILNTFKFKKEDGDALVDDSADQIPNSWWIGGLAISAPATVGVTWWMFDIPPLLSIVAIILSSVLAMIAVRSTGETDINPIGGMGKVTQLVFGALAPGAITTNLMSAAITGSGASQAGDMMQDLKTGYMLGARPKAQFKAQIIGILFGIAFCVPIFLLFDEVYEIGGADLPAPAAHAWRAVAELLAKGLDALPPGAEWAVLGGAIFGALLPIARKFAPEKAKAWVPSALAFGIAFIVGAYYSIAMFVGAVIFIVWKRLKPEQAAGLSFAVASGLVAGEGLAGIVKALLMLAGVPTLAQMLM